MSPPLTTVKVRLEVTEEIDNIMTSILVKTEMMKLAIEHMCVLVILY